MKFGSRFALVSIILVLSATALVQGTPCLTESLPESLPESDSEQGPKLLCASSGTHLWVAVRSGTGCQIIHHAPDMDGSFCRVATTLPAIPSDLAARENQLAIVMSPDPQSKSSAVFMLSAHRNPATGIYFYEPLGRLDVLASIPSSDRIEQVVLGSNGPIALDGGDRPKLVKAEQLGWVDLAPPMPMGVDAVLAPWSSQTSLALWSIVWVDGEDLMNAGISATLSQGTVWSAGDWALERWIGAGANFEMAIGGTQRPAILTRDGGGAFGIAYPTSNGVRQLSTIHIPNATWSIVGLGEGFEIVWSDDVGQVYLSSVDGLTGESAPARLLGAQPTTTGDWIHLPLLGVVTIGMLLAGFIVRPPIQPPTPMPGGWEVLAMVRRASALAIDMIPGAIFALWITGAHVDELLAMPSWTPDLETAAPASIMLGFTGLWSLAFEVSIRATPGKFLVGGRVIRAPEGGSDLRAGWRRTFVRALLKIVVLFAPALGFLAFVHPLQQGLPETLSKTVIARRH